MIVDLPYPHKHLWPNGPRSNHHAVSREKRKHFDWALLAASVVGAERRNEVRAMEVPIPITITVCGRQKGPLPDRDNCSAAAKIYLDAIAKKLDINDRNFAAPQVKFADERTSRFIIEVGG